MSPVELLQHLIRFDTTNPPGNERACVLFIEELLRAAGINTTLVGRSEERPNLIARIPGRGTAPGLLLQGHVDVVTTANQIWTHPPFEGRIADGFVWGRGALDMKGGVAMMIAALLAARGEGLTPAGDIVLAVLCDEENGSHDGARFLVEHHPELFHGVRHAIGEFGGFTFSFSGRSFYPIQIAEKQTCALAARVRGPGGHASIVMRGGAMARLARLVDTLDRQRLPTHVTPAARLMLEAMASALSFPASAVLRGLTRERLTDRVLTFLGPRGALFDALLHNTVNATIVRGGEKGNVIPSEITVTLDGRILPGYTPDDLLRELRGVTGDDVEYEVLAFDPAPAILDMSLYDTLAAIVRDADPDGIPIPYLQGAVTDARFFARLGIQSYGFLPMKLPPDFNFAATIHAADERIPVEAVEFGTRAVLELLRRR